MTQQYHCWGYTKECDTGYSRGTCTPMFIATLFTTVKLWKQPRCPISDEWIKKMWYLCTMEFYTAMKKNEMLSFTSKWMELDHIILSEVSLAQKTKNCDKARAHKGGMRIGKTSKKLRSICCPQRRETKADTLKQLRTIGEGDQELKKRLVQEKGGVGKVWGEGGEMIQTLYAHMNKKIKLIN
jgi:hypothetical protein